MFYIKLEDDLSLVITERDVLRRGDNLSKKVIYLVPQAVGELDAKTAFFYLNYIRADGVADIVMLERMEDMYNETYYQFTFPITCKLTRFAGSVCTWMQIYDGSMSNPMVAKSGECVLQIEDSKNMDDYVSDRVVTALYQYDKKVADGFADANSRIDDNADAITQNIEAIAQNAEAIAQNAEAIGENAQAIADNSSVIETNAVAIGENSAAISENAEAIHSAFGAIEENTADIATNKQAIADNSAAIAQNSMAIGQNADAIRANISAIAQINAILAQHSNDIGLLSDALANVSATLEGKADGLTYDLNTGVLQLTSDGNPIGNGVVIQTSGKLISSTAINDDGELVVSYTDGTSETLGKVVGENGKTYVPHIDEHNVISWTIEDEPPGEGDEPDPVDLNPDDEWSDIGDETAGKSDYTWDSI